MARAAVIAVLVLAAAVGPSLCNGETSEDGIKKICQQMYFYYDRDFCIKTLNQHLKSPNTDLAGLAQITVEQSLIKATNSHNLALYFLKTATGPAKVALASCESTTQRQIMIYKKISEYSSKADFKKVLDTVEQFPPPNECNKSLRKVSPSGSFDSLVKSNDEMWTLVTMTEVAAYQLTS